MGESSPSRYVIKSVIHASAVLAAFRSSGEVLRLRDVVARTGFNKGMCFRFLYTLHECGLLDKVGENQYRRITEVRPNRRYRIGYASQGQDHSFPREVLAGLVRAAEAAHVELIVTDNRSHSKGALRSAEYLIREQVDLAIEFQTDEAVAPAIAAKYLQANVPFIAIDVPHPGATYFGANNYESGLIGGRHLGRWAKRHWDSVDEIMLIEFLRAGSLPAARARGVLAGMNEVLHLGERTVLARIDGAGQFKQSLEAVRKHLRASRSSRILVGAANDPSALGALRAFEEAGRAADCAVVGHNAEPEARAELRNPGSPLIGSVAHFPEKYGAGLIRLALDILAHKPVPPACFIKHQLISPENVDHFYPNDAPLRIKPATV